MQPAFYPDHPAPGALTALEDGRLSQERWHAYLKLQREMSIEAHRAEIRRRKEETGSARRRRRAEPQIDEW